MDHEMRALYISLAETLNGQATTLRALADLVDREQRAALLDTALSHNKWAAHLMSELESFTVGSER